LIIEDDEDLAAIFAEALYLAELETEIIVSGGPHTGHYRRSRSGDGGWSPVRLFS